MIELLQNSRRAGAARVDISATPLGDGAFNVVVRDNGRGLDDPAKLVGLGSSDWDAATEAVEDPAGCGFFALSALGATARSRDWEVVLTRDAFLGKESAPVLPMAPIDGFEVTFTLRDPLYITALAIKHTVTGVSKFGPLDVTFDGEEIERENFFDGALWTRSYQGVRIGVFKGRSTRNFNFHGLVIDSPLRDSVVNGEDSYSVAFDVLEATQLRLTLPQRDKVVQNDFYGALAIEGRRLIYEYIATLPSHRLSFHDYKEALDLGIALQESEALLSSYEPDWGDPDGQTFEKAGPLPENPMVCDISERGIGQTIAWAVGVNPDTFKFKLLDGRYNHTGYEWYDALPHITGLSYIIDGQVVPEDEGLTLDPRGKRPETLAIRLKIEQKGKKARTIDLPTNLILPPIESWGSSIEFTFTRENPFKDAQAQSDLWDVLRQAYFEFHDSGDTFESQEADFDRDLRTLMTTVFGGRKQAALGNLQEAVWELNSELTEAGLKSITVKLVDGRWVVADANPKKGKAKKK